MFVTAVVGLLLVLRAPAWVPTVVVATVVSLPIGALAATGAVGHAWMRKRRVLPAVDEAAVCASIAAELHAGASLRDAVAAACRNHASEEILRAGRRATSGAPAGAVAASLSSALPRNGRHAALAFELADESGAAAAAVFDRLASRALRDAELRREVAAATAQARLSATVVGGAPVAVLVLLAVTGRIGVFTDSGGAGLVVGILGVGLVLSGLGVVWLLLRADR